MMNKLKIKDLAKQIRGVSYKTSDLHEELDSQSVILLRANNISNGLINFDDVIYVDKQKVSEIQYLKKGDILICASSGSKKLVGKAASVDFDMECTFGAFCKVVRPKEEYMDYLGSYFQSSIYRNKISKASLGANINNIRNEHIDGLEIPLYSKENMSTITKRMQLLQKIIININQELKLLDELVKARFVELFGDPIINDKGLITELLANVSNLKAGKAIKTGELSENNDTNSLFPCFGGNGIRGYINRYTHDGTFPIIGRQGALSGNVNFAKGKFYATEHAIVVTPKVELDDTWFFFCLKYLDLKRFQTGAAQPGVSVEKLNNISIPLPNYKSQLYFSDFVKEVDKSRLEVQKSLKKTQELFDSLMQKYFG